MLTYVTVYSQLEVLRKCESFDAGDVAQIKEPNVGKDLAFPYITGDYAAKDVNLDSHVGRSIDPRQLIDSQRRYDHVSGCEDG